MTRRVLASVFFAAAAFALLATADGPTPSAKADDQPKVDKVETGPAALADVRDKQSRMMTDFKKIKEELQLVANRLQNSAKPEDKAAGKRLADALTQQGGAIEIKFEDVNRLLKAAKSDSQADMEKVLKKTGELEQDIHNLVALLEKDNRKAELKAMIAETQRRIEEIKRLIREQDNARFKTELGKGDKKQLGDAQKKITGDTDAVAKGNAKKDSQGGEAKSAGDGKGDGKNGGESKAAGKNDTGESKGGEKKPGDKDPKDAKGESKDSKGDPKDGKGDSKGSKGDPKDAKSDSKGGEGGKGEPKDAKSDSKGKGDGKGEGKGEPKDSKGGEGQSSSKGGGQGQQQAGGSKSGGQQQQPPPPKKDDQPDFPGRKQVQDAVGKQQQAEKEIDKGNNDAAAKKQGDAKKDLEDAKKKLEDLLRQLREEEIERILADLQGRCEKMLAAQKAVRNGTVDLDAKIKTRANEQPDKADVSRGDELARDEGKIMTQADETLRILREEGSARAFPAVLDFARGLMTNVRDRLKNTDAGDITVATEDQIIASLEQMVEALKQARKENGQPPPPPPGGGGGNPNPPNQPLLKEIQELKLIRSMQLQVNQMTELYAKGYKGDQSPAPEKIAEEREKKKAQMLQDENKKLGVNQKTIEEVTNDLYKGKNK
jgi:hypothetical protein